MSKSCAVLIGIIVIALPFEALAQKEPTARRALAPTNVTLEHVLAVHQRARQAVRNIIVELEVTTQFNPPAGRADDLSNRMVEAFSRQMDVRIAAAIEAGVNGARLDRALEPYMQQLDDVEKYVRVEQLNRVVTVRRVATIDFEGARARYEDSDTRDIEQLIETNKLGFRMRSSLDRSRVDIVRSGANAVRLMTAIGDLAVVSAHPIFDAPRARFSIGLIPSWVAVDGRFDLSLRQVPSGGVEEIEIVGRSGGASGDVSVRMTLRPKFGYALSKLVSYDENGRAAFVFGASDFRRVGDLFFPFKTSVRFAREGIPDYRVETRKVQSIQVNRPIPDSVFAIPSGYRVQDTTDVKARIYRMP